MTTFMAMVLAAGYGTRLSPLTLELPKPLVPIGDRSLLAHVALGLARAGARRIVVNSHHLASAVADEVDRLRQGELEGEPEVVHVHEPQILGTAGGVANAAAALGPGDVVAVNGDILAELELGALLRLHQHRRAFATLGTGPQLPCGQGTLGLAVDGAVVRLRGRVFGAEISGADFLGAQVLSTRARAALPLSGCLVGDVYLPALARGETLVACAIAPQFRDIGTPAAYLDSNLAWLRERSLASYASPSARVAREVTLVDTVVGADAEVTGTGELVRVVVWPGGKAVAPLRDAVVTPQRTVAIDAS